MNFEKPAGYEFMNEGAQERARTNQRVRARQNVLSMSGAVHELSEVDGVLDPLKWEGRTPPRRRWLVPGLIPRGEVTLLSGVGGEGKSMLAAQLQFSASHGLKWLGRSVARSNSYGVFCEDNADEIWRRFDGISRGEGVGFAENMIPVCRKGKDNILFQADNNDMVGQTTVLYERLRRSIERIGAQVVILDSLYNFYGGNENSRPQANQFIGALGRVAEEIDGAVILIAHPSLQGISSKTGRAGSTAWHDAVRSRLYLHRLPHPSGDLEREGTLVLQHMKANYAVKEKPIEIVYERGRFVPVMEPTNPPAHWSDLGE